MKVLDLVPGDLLDNPLIGSGVFIGQMPHPLYKGLRLVIWRLNDNSVSFDALRADQELEGNIISNSKEQLKKALGIK